MTNIHCYPSRVSLMYIHNFSTFYFCMCCLINILVYQQAGWCLFLSCLINFQKLCLVISKVEDLFHIFVDKLFLGHKGTH